MIVSAKRLTEEQTIECDVIVIGTGAGGGMALADLARPRPTSPDLARTRTVIADLAHR